MSKLIDTYGIPLEQGIELVNKHQFFNVTYYFKYSDFKIYLSCSYCFSKIFSKITKETNASFTRHSIFCYTCKRFSIFSFIKIHPKYAFLSDTAEFTALNYITI